MGSSLAQLLAAPTSDEALATLLAFLQLGGFPATSWQSGSAGPVLTNMEAQFFASLANAIAKVAAGGYLARPGDPTSGAQGPWLDLLGEQIFQDKRGQAAFTVGNVTLVDAANAGPFTITPNGLTVSEVSKAFLFQSTNATNLTLPLGGSLTLAVQAANAGAAYNLAPGTINTLITSLPGVTVANLASGGQTWITAVGIDAETDDFYTARLAAKWSTLGSGSDEGAYFYNATTPSVTGTLEVTQCRVFAVGGLVNVVIAGANGPVSITALQAVDAAIQAKRPMTDQAVTVNATASQTVIAGTLYVKGTSDTAATLSAVQVALAQLFRTVPIGGTLYRDQIIQTAMNVPGVYNLALTSPAADVVLGSSTVLTPIFLLTATH